MHARAPPVAPHQTSVAFGAVLATFLFREPFWSMRIILSLRLLLACFRCNRHNDDDSCMRRAE